MTVFQIVEAKPYHVGMMVRRMRGEVLSGPVALGLDPHREMAAKFHRSAFRRSWFIDGQLAALGGVSGMLATSTGFVWLAFSQDALRFPVEIMRETKRQLAWLMATHEELTTTIAEGDTVSRRFAERLGFVMTRSTEPGLLAMRLARGHAKSKPAPYVIFSMPRSRTAWLAALLSYRGRNCWHDLPVDVGSIDEMCAILSRPRAGTVWTGLSVAWRVLRQRFPDARFVVVRRPIDEVSRSAKASGWDVPDAYLEVEATRLSEISAQPGVLTINAAELDNEDTCREVFEHCLQRPFDAEWWRSLASRNIQIDMPARMAELEKNRTRFAALFHEVMDTVTIQEETFDTFSADAPTLFAEHYAEVGRMDGLPFDPNMRKAQAMAEIGALLIMTARTGHGLIGYLVFGIDESLESKNVLVGYQSIFFVRKAYRAQMIGPRLHKAARVALKSRGVQDLILRSGIRGSGPKQKVLFKKLGATFLGDLYGLRLGA